MDAAAKRVRSVNDDQRDSECVAKRARIDLLLATPPFVSYATHPSNAPVFVSHANVASVSSTSVSLSPVPSGPSVWGASKN